MLRPDVVASGRENAVGIDRILQRGMETLQGAVVEGVHVHDRLLEHRGRAVLAPAMLSADFDQFLEPFAIALIGLRILGHGSREDEDEGSLPEARWQRES